MQQTIEAYVLNPDKPASLDNLDLGARSYLETIKENGHKFEFEKYNPITGLVGVTIEFPDLPTTPAPGSQEEWDERRAWYLEHAGTNFAALNRGLAEGYLINKDAEWMMTAGLDDWDATAYTEENKLEEQLENIKQPARIKSRRNVRKIVKIAGLKKEDLKQAKTNPWEFYELLKDKYCSQAESPEEYDSTIEKVVFALKI